jgi:hypothetical protein
VNKRGFLKTLGAIIGLSITGIPVGFSNAKTVENVHILTLTDQIKRDMEKACKPYMFEPNDEKTRESMSYTVSCVLDDFHTRNKIQSFYVTSHPITDENVLQMVVWIQPPRTQEYVVIDVTIPPIS